jgi:hypothetical protein
MPEHRNLTVDDPETSAAREVVGHSGCAAARTPPQPARLPRDPGVTDRAEAAKPGYRCPIPVLAPVIRPFFPQLVDRHGYRRVPAPVSLAGDLHAYLSVLPRGRQPAAVMHQEFRTRR